MSGWRVGWFGGGIFCFWSYRLFTFRPKQQSTTQSCTSATTTTIFIIPIIARTSPVLNPQFAHITVPKMSGYQPRYSIAPPHNRQSSLSGGPTSLAASHQSPALVTRIEEKKQELESLIALRDLSGNLASQMEQLEEKLSTLADGTEGLATLPHCRCRTNRTNASQS